MRQLAAERVRLYAAVLGSYYGALAVAHGILLPPATAALMMTIAGGTAVAFLWLYVYGRSPQLAGRGHTAIALMAALVMGNSLAHLGLTSEIRQTTNVALALLGGGLLFFDRAWLVLYLAASLAGWSITASSCEPREDLPHYAFMLLTSCVLSALTLHVRLRAVEALEGMRVANREAGLRVKAEQEKRELERRMLHGQKLESLGVLAGGIAHDFNNVLVSVVVNAESAKALQAEDSKARPYLDDVIEAGRHAAELTHQILDYSGKGRLVAKAIYLQDVLGGCERLLRASAPANVSFERHVEDGVPAVEGDSSQLQQVILNLVLNGAEAIGDKRGRVVVRLDQYEADNEFLSRAAVGADAPPGRFVRLEVCDNGSGMDSKRVERMFDPFFSTKGTGRGLGLAAVSGIVRSHRGALRVDSKLGDGTCVTVLLPPSLEATVADRQSVRPDREIAGQAVVLIADDEERVRRSARGVLESKGFHVIEAPDGATAVERMRSRGESIDLLLLDVTMPGMTGLQVLEETKDLHIRTILTSGYGEAMGADLSGNVVGYLRKPYATEDLLGAVAVGLSARG